MENEQNAQTDGEPPIYGEMKPVPVTLESCILSSEDNFPYNETDEALVTKDNCDDGELSAEEINSMIMINEGPNALSSVQEEFESSKVNLSIRNSSDIKKILTSDLPKAGRFLSTKSLQKLSGAKKVIKKNTKYESKANDEAAEEKNKKVFAKQNKSVKENIGKSSQSKMFEPEISRKNVKPEKLKMKSLKKGNSIEKLTNKKKSLKIFKKIGISKNKDLSSASKVFKKKVLENNGVVKKEGIHEGSQDGSDKTTGRASKGKKKSKTDNKPKLLISRSGRIRKVKDVPKDYVAAKNKEGKVLSTAEDGEMLTAPVVCNSETKMESKKQAEPVDEGSKFDYGKENKSQGDLLQSALSESVESWFDITTGMEKKGKRTRGRVKIIPRDSDTCFEETENPVPEKDCTSKILSETADVKKENPEVAKEEVDSNNAEKPIIKKEEETNDLQGLIKAAPESAKNEENEESDSKEQKPKADDNKKVAAVSSKKNKTSNRHVIGYKKKRRKLKNVTVSSYLKNYGERIDFEIKLDSESETKGIDVAQKTNKTDLNSTKKETGGVENSKEDKSEEVESGVTDPDEGSNKDEGSAEEVRNSPLKKSPSAENLILPVDSKVEDPQEAAEMPIVEPCEKNEELIKKDASVNVNTEKENESKSKTLAKAKKGKMETRKGRQKRKTVEKETLIPSEEKKMEEPKIGEESEPKIGEESKSKIDEEPKPKIGEESKPKIDEEPKPKIGEESKPKIDEEPKPKIGEESKPKIDEKPKPKIGEESEPKICEASEPKICEESEPKIGKESEPKTGEESEPKIGEESEPKISEESEPKIGEESEPKIGEESEPKISEESEPKIDEESKPKEKEISNEISIIRKKIQQKRRRTLCKTKVFGLRNKRKARHHSRKEKIKFLKKVMNEDKQTKRIEEEPKLKDLEREIKITENKENDKGPDGPNEKPEPEVDESFSASPNLSIPFKKRPRRPKVSENLEEVGKEVKEEINNSEKQECERRKSHREIKLTPKIVDMIATSFGYKRSRKASSTKEEEMHAIKEDSESSGKKSGDGAELKTHEGSSDQPLVTAPFVENYLQSKMEANASNFESSWEPGDLVWARFAGNPFWPALILRDPFSNDEYSRVKYLGRLPRPFVHVQFLADYGRRAWGPELYIMNFNGLDEFEKLKSNLPEVNAFTQRKDLMYQQAFFAPKKMERNWVEAVKEGETLIHKSKDERITYMKIKYPLVKYAASVANGRLVPNERSKLGDLKTPLLKTKKRKGLASASTPEGSPSDWSSKKSEETLSKDTFECVNTSDLEEGKEKSHKDSPKITLKLVRSPKKGSKRKSSKAVDEGGDKKLKKRIRKEALDDDYAPSDSGSNGEKGSETTSNKQKKYFLFKGAKTEKVCQICFEILENEKTVKCKGACQGLFHKSCAEKMSANLPPLEGLSRGVKNKRRKKLFADEESDNSTDTQPKEVGEKEWRCNDCLRGENPCFVCNSRSGNRQRCCVAYCGKFYHQKCLKLYPQTIYNQGAPIRKSQFLQQKKTAESESPHYQILSCPLHVCHTCASDNPADFNMKYLCEKLVKCIKCPSAYHGGNYCVPAGSTILNTSQIICAKHGDPGKKSHVNISWCFICNMGGSLICCEWCPSSFHLDCLNIKPPEGPYICEECESGRFPLYGEVVWVKLGRYRWWPARVLFPQEILPNIMALPHKSWEFAVQFYGSKDHYWLNRGRVFLYQEGDSEQKFKGQSHVDKIYQRAVQEATKDYFAIQEERKSRLLGTNNSGVMKPPPYVKIKTNKAVGKVQLGNVSQSEPQTCDCDPNSEAPCSPGSDCLNRMLLVECNPNYCNAGSRCWNQSFEKREYPPLEPYRTERRGWGLRSCIDIPKGSFVIEYVGEVVDDEEFKRRMKRKQETKDSNYYFLTIDKDRMIDAGPKGNLARFMNHSCSPNCETQKWTVNGDTRVGLFSLRDIPAGTELTFNYNLDCIGNEKKACHCEQENCSGFIGVKAKNDKSEALKNKMVKRLEKESEDECFVCGDGGELMVCDVPHCPKVYHVECVNLTEWPNELWFCPRHRCSLCKRTTKRCCKLCPTAYCFAHLDNNMFPDNQGGLLCSRHSTCAVKPAQILRKASYVNRNTPVVEYEKPFAEKYRPPPPKERNSPEEKKEEILMEPNLTDNTPIVVENPLLSPATPTRLSDGVSVQVLYVDEEGQIVSVDESTTASTGEVGSSACDREVPKPIKRKKRTNIPRKKLNPPVAVEEAGSKAKSQTSGGINFESLMIKSVEDKILDSKLNMDNIYNIIGGGRGGGGGGGREGDTGQSESDSAERCELKPETVNKKEEAEVDRSRRSKYFKIITPEKFIKVSESECNQKKVTDFNYIEFMHPLRSARSKSKTDENTRK